MAMTATKLSSQPPSLRLLAEKRTNGRLMGGGGSDGRGQQRRLHRGAVVRQLLENQNTKGHWCPVDG